MLWNFGVTSDDGEQPFAGLLADKWGNLYGTTDIGGANGDGTVFELSPPIGHQTQWSERVLYSFNGDDGSSGNGLIFDKWGNLYGTASGGGANGYGIVFELSPPGGKSTPWSESVLWTFSAARDNGATPEAGLLADKWGNLYTTTSSGGADGIGTVFELSPPVGQSTPWSGRVLWSFSGFPDDGESPFGGLIADKWGNFYSTTLVGGADGIGTVFELTAPAGQSTQWSEQVLWSFSGFPDDGGLPFAGLIADKWGNLYGTTSYGGVNCPVCGTVFELSLP